MKTGSNATASIAPWQLLDQTLLAFVLCEFVRSGVLAHESPHFDLTWD
jgi:hypothetical protein